MCFIEARFFSFCSFFRAAMNRVVSFTAPGGVSIGGGTVAELDSALRCKRRLLALSRSCSSDDIYVLFHEFDTGETVMLLWEQRNPITVCRI